MFFFTREIRYEEVIVQDGWGCLAEFHDGILVLDDIRWDASLWEIGSLGFEEGLLDRRHLFCEGTKSRHKGLGFFLRSFAEWLPVDASSSEIFAYTLVDGRWLLRDASCKFML